MNLIEKAFRDVSREEWKSRIGEQEKVYLLEDHVSNMKGLLSDLNYETYCIDGLIENTKNMDLSGAERYTNLMESIAYFYCNTLNKDIATAIITGIVARTKDVKGIEKYHGIIVRGLDGRMSRYRKSMSIYGLRLDALSTELKRNNTGLFRFFKRKKIATIERKIKRLEARNEKVKSKFEKAKELAGKVGAD